jgi:hypothetical protein
MGEIKDLGISGDDVIKNTFISCERRWKMVQNLRCFGAIYFNC